jgi:TDG/mug DNA glycosylase family protein
MRHYAPRALAFLGKRAFSTMVGQRDIDWGRQPTVLAGTMVWVLPNPSGLSRNFTLDALVEAYSELQRELAASNILKRL